MKVAKKYTEKYYSRYGDPRTADWFFMDSQLNLLMVVILYLLVVKFIGPFLMRTRRPLRLRRVMISYNIAMAILNSWLFYKICYLTLLKENFSWRCQSVDWSMKEQSLKLAEVLWILLISKVLELSDTIFLVLRHKSSKITVIHLFLRIYALILVWYGVKFAPGGYNSVNYAIICFVNIWTYLYYTLTTSSPNTGVLIGWKNLSMRYLLQFIVIFIYNAQLYLLTPKNCNLSFFIVRLNISSAIFFFIFSWNFYSTKKKGATSTKTFKTI